jgi:hypothetical protein
MSGRMNRLPVRRAVREEGPVAADRYTMADENRTEKGQKRVARGPDARYQAL